MRAHTATLRAEIYRRINARGPEGLTCDEIEATLGLRHQSASARVNELHTRRFIRDSGKRRLTRSGRKAIVWVASEIA